MYGIFALLGLAVLWGVSIWASVRTDEDKNALSNKKD